MFFHKAADIDGILRFIRPKLEATLNSCKYGIDIEIKEKKKDRSTDQNRYLWAIYKNITEFYHQTGFIVDELPLKFINSDILHEYFKARFDVKSTAKLSTIDFMSYTDRIQNLITEQSKGEYNPIYPDDSYCFQQM